MKYFAFFRGINVGGKHIVKMADLKALFAGLGFQDVTTYIQSGNVVFSSDNEKPQLQARIENAFQNRFGFQSTVIIRSSTELDAILGAQAFSPAELEQARAANPDIEHLYVYLAGEPIDAEKVKQVCGSYKGRDKIHIADSEIYLLCYESVTDSGLAKLLSRLPYTFTARNLNTMNKIAELCKPNET